MMFLLFVAIFSTLLFAGLVSAALKLPTRPAFLAGVLLLSFANIIFVSQTLGALGMFNVYAFTLFHLFLAALSILIWRRKFREATNFWFRSKFAGQINLLSSLKYQPELWLLSSCVAIAYTVNAVLIYIVPSNNWDSMTYHLSRVGYWLQHDSLSPWVTHNLRQTTFPINAELGALWTVLFWGTDQLAGYIQFMAAILGLVVIFGLARFLDYSRAQSLFAALIWATLPEILLQSTTTQNDLLAGALFAAMLYFLFIGLKNRHVGALLLSGLAIGMGIGTKLTVLMPLPGVAIGLLFFLYQQKKQVVKSLVIWSAACLAGFIFLGAYNFGMVTAVYGSPLGPPAYVREIAGSEPGVDRLRLTQLNSLRYLYQAADLTGVPKFAQNSLYDLKATSGQAIFQLFNLDPNPPGSTKSKNITFDLWAKTPTNEDHSWFGLLGFSLLIPAIIYQGVFGFLRKDPYRITLTAASIVFFIVVAAAMSWSPWRGRYFVIVVTASAPFLAMFYQPGWKFLPLRWALVLAAIVIMINTLMYNTAKPLTGKNAIWNLDYLERRTLTRSSMEPILRAIDQNVPPNGRLGLILGGDDWDYPLFGRHLTRQLIPIYPPDTLNNVVNTNKQNIDYLLVNHREVKDQLSLDALPALTNYQLVAETYPFYLLALTNDNNLDIWLELLGNTATPPQNLPEENNARP